MKKHKKIRVYLDNCCLNRPFDDQQNLKIKLEAEAKLFVQQKIKENEIELAWSYILEYENSENPFVQKKETISKWQSISKIDINENQKIIKTSEEICKLNIKHKDALHIACAIEAKCDYFLTTDIFLIKKAHFIDKIIIMNPINFINELEVNL